MVIPTLLPSLAAWAQTATQVIDEGLRRQEERARDQQLRLQPKADVLKPQTTSEVSTALPTETPCFVIRKVHIAGPDAGQFDWLLNAAQPYAGQCAGVNGLAQIASALDASLIDRGYVTSRVTLPRQNLGEGILTLQLHVGRVARIDMVAADKAQAPDQRWGTWRNAFPVASGHVLNVRDLEQGIEQMKRLPSQSVTTTLEPGAGPDTSNLKILRRSGRWQDRLRGGLTVDNAGNKALGRTQLYGSLSLDNALGLNDIVSISANTNAENPHSTHRTQAYSFNYSLPWGYNTFTFSKSSSRYAQYVQGTTVQMLSSGESESDEIRWHRTLWRSSASKFAVYGSLSTRQSNGFVNDVEVLTQRRRTANAEVGFSFRHLFDRASLDVDLGYRRGIGWRRAQDDLPSASTGGPTQRPTITTFSAVVDQPLDFGDRLLRYNLSLRSQFTHDLTLAIDQFAIGNRYSVRGFAGDNVLLAESGLAVRNELSMAISPLNGLSTSVYAGIDFGRVWGASAAQLVGDKLAGATFGLRAQTQRLQIDLALGTPLYKPEGFLTTRWNPYFMLTYAY